MGFEQNYGINSLKKLIKDSNHSRTFEKTSSPRLNVMDVWAPYIVIFGFPQNKFFKICERIVFLMQGPNKEISLVTTNRAIRYISRGLP